MPKVDKRRVNKSKLQECEGDGDQVAVKPSKVEMEVANYMKKHVPIKRTKFLNHQVNYFIASKAIDVLLDSHFATGPNAVFTDRNSVARFANALLKRKFFHRARKIAITDKDLSIKDLKRKKEIKKIEEKKNGNDSKSEEKSASNPNSPSSKKKRDRDAKKKTRIKLDMHLQQIFVDGSDAYVWIYDPIPFWYYIVGGLLLFAAVAICLFPLWPPMVRQGVYYLSIGGAGFLGVILGLAVLKTIIFLTIWILSLGRHHFWMLPNLTEDVGFFESFWPLYAYEYRGSDYVKKPKSKKRLKEGESSSSAPANGSVLVSAGAKGDLSKSDSDKHDTDDVERSASGAGGSGPEDTESEPSQSHPFEVIDNEDLTEDDPDLDLDPPSEEDQETLTDNQDQ